MNRNRHIDNRFQRYDVSFAIENSPVCYHLLFHRNSFIVFLKFLSNIFNTYSIIIIFYYDRFFFFGCLFAAHCVVSLYNGYTTHIIYYHLLIKSYFKASISPFCNIADFYWLFSIQRRMNQQVSGCQRIHESEMRYRAPIPAGRLCKNYRIAI